jgi:hypothetical protein
MTLPRYSKPDDYTLEELRRKFTAADSTKRIAILKWLYREHGRPPYEIARSAVEDPYAEVQLWLAQHGRELDYREIDWQKREEEEKYEKQLRERSWADFKSFRSSHTPGPYIFPERDLKARLESSQDPVIRAGLRENPNFVGMWLVDNWIEVFRKATPLERLALVRNPRVGDEFIERVFDPEDTQLPINGEERKALIVAYLSNREVLAESQDFSNNAYWRFYSGFPDFVEAYDRDSIWRKRKEHFSKLWELASKWPLESGIPWSVYEHVGVPDDVRADHYKKNDNAHLREIILRGCTKSDVKTLRLGLADPEEDCRSIAISKGAKIEESKKTRYWQTSKKTLRYLGVGLIHTIKIGIIVLVLNKSTSVFETIALVLLVLSYQGLSEVQTRSGLTLFSLAYGLDQKFRHIGKLLNEKLSEDEEQAEIDALRATSEGLRTAQINYSIGGFASLVVFIICILRLAQTVL